MDRGEHLPQPSLLSRLRPLAVVALLLGALALTPFRPLKVTGRSMEPTLRNGETLLLDQFYWRAGGVSRNDIVVVKHERENWVKRLIGMPGDHLRMTYGQGGWIVQVDNLTVNPTDELPGPDTEDRVVAADEIFVIGDNMNRSADSTNQEAGAFKLEDIVGIVRTFTLQRDFPFQRHL